MALRAARPSAASSWTAVLRTSGCKRGSARRTPRLRSGRRHVVLWGESIGSGVATALLAEEVDKRKRAPDASLVLEAAFTSCVDLGAHAYPWLPVRLGMLDRFDSAARARTMVATLGGDDEKSFASLSLHGEHDEIAPLIFGQGLHDALPGGRRKRLVVLPGTGHNDVQFVSPSRYLREVAAFLSEEVMPLSHTSHSWGG